MKYKHYINFLISLEQLLRAGIDISSALKIIASNNKHKNIRRKIYIINNEITKGSSLSYAIKKHINLKNTYSNIISIGEDSGNISDILKFIYSKEQKLTRLRSKALKASIYPAIVIATTIFTLALIISKIIPEFILLFNEFKTPIPKQINFIYNSINYLKYFLVIFSSLILAIVLIYYTSNNKSKLTLQLKLQKIIIKTPIISKVVSKFILYNFFFTLGLCLKSGIPISNAISICANATNFASYKHTFLKIKDALTNGSSLSNSLQDIFTIPDFCKKLVNIGETTGNIDKIILEIAAIFERDIVNFLDKFIIMLEPGLVLIVGVLVGYIVISLYAPLINIGTIL